MSKICRRYANICQMYAKYMPKIAIDMLKICQRYAKDMRKICQRYARYANILTELFLWMTFRGHSRINEGERYARAMIKIRHRYAKDTPKIHSTKWKQKTPLASALSPSGVVLIFEALLENSMVKMHIKNCIYSTFSIINIYGAI